MTDRQHVAVAHPVRIPIVACRVLLLALITSGFPGLAALGAEGTWRDMLPFGRDEAPVDNDITETGLLSTDPLSMDPATEPLPAEEESNGWMVTSPFGNVTWPEIKMPQFEFNPPWRSTANGEGGWFTTPIAKVRRASQGAIARTRSAWNGTIDRMKFALPGGRDTDWVAEPQIAGETPQPGFWQRMLGPKDSSAESDDVVELMAREPGATQR